MKPKTTSVKTWVSLALPRKSAHEPREYMHSPFAVGSVAFATDGYRAHVCADVPADPADSKAEQAANVLSRMMLDARKGYRVTMPARLLREVSGVMGKHSKEKSNILRMRFVAGCAEFERVSVEQTVCATVDKADGYAFTGEYMSIAVDPGYLADALSAVKTQDADPITISIANAHSPFVIDYHNLTAVIMPQNVR